jgi:hypothetical protein
VPSSSPARSTPLVVSPCGQRREQPVDALLTPWRHRSGSTLEGAPDYLPDKQEKATQTVLEQAEVLSEQWAAA